MSNFLLGFLAGAAAGALAGILLAPDKGSITRQNIKKKVQALADEYGLGLGELMNEMGVEPEHELKTKIPRAKPGTKTQKPPSVAKRKYTRKPKTEL